MPTEGGYAPVSSEGVEMQPVTQQAPKLEPPKMETWLHFNPPKMPIQDYKINRGDLYPRFHGTVLYHVWQSMLYYTVITVVFFTIYMVTSDAYCSGGDDTTCRPEWFDEHLSSLTMLSEKLTVLASFVLTFYLSQAYGRYNDFYWKIRAIQGRINDIALIVGSNIDYSKEGKAADVQEYASTFERYLNLVQFLVHAPLSPVLKTFDIIGDASKSVLLNESILGLQLVNEEELHYLNEAKRLGGPNGPVNVVLSWMCMMFDRGSSPQEGFFRDNIIQARMISLHITFQDNVEDLRGAVATLGFEKQLPIPVAYAQLMQLFIDVLLHLHPFAIVYEINTVVIESAGYNDMDRWSTLPFTVMGAVFFVYFYSGLLSLAKSFNSPLGRKSFNAADGTKQLHDKEFYIETRAIMNQTRAGTYLFFNCSKMAPKIVRQSKLPSLPPLSPSQGDEKVGETRRHMQRAASKRNKSTRLMAASKVEGVGKEESKGQAPSELS